MKIISTLYDSKHLVEVLNVSDGIILGNNQVGTRLTKSFSLEDICQMIEITKDLNKEVFIQANQMFNDAQLDFFNSWISSLPLHKIDGVVVGDLGAFRMLSKLGYAEKAIYNPETLMTNVYDFNFLKDAGIKGVYIAKEITLEVPVKVVGNSKGVMAGGVLRLNQRKLKVKALPKNLPDFVEADITELEMGNKLYVTKLVSDNYTLMHPDNTVVAQVRISRAAMKAAQEAAKAEKGAAKKKK